MLIGEIANKSGLSREGVRYYESLGLIRSKPLQAGSRTYRDYDPDTLKRLSYIRLGKRLGYSLKELPDLLAQLHIEGGHIWESDAHHRADVLTQKLRQVEEQIADLQAAKVELETLLDNSEPEFLDRYLKREGYWVE